MNTPELLTAYETCPRKGYWARDWKRRRPTGTEILQQAVRAGVTEATREDFGEVAGEAVMDLAVDPGMELPASHNLHQSVIHHAALADLLTTAVRKPQTRAWGFPPPKALGSALWQPDALLDPSGASLRRVLLVSAWNDDRHYAESRSWYGLGEVALYGLPMTMLVLLVGANRDGRRSGPWTRGFLHPQNHKLRFRKKSRATFESFTDSWVQVWREDRGDISNTQWLQGMLDDDILRDVCFPVEIPVPSAAERQRIRGMAERKLLAIAKATSLPDASLSVCDRPPCLFRGCCWSKEPYLPDGKSGFIKISI